MREFLIGAFVGIALCAGALYWFIRAMFAWSMATLEGERDHGPRANPPAADGCASET